MPFSFAVTGAINAGKSTLAARLALDYGAELLASDSIRSGLSLTQQRSGARVFSEMRRRFALVREQNRRAVLDSTGMSHRFRSLLHQYRAQLVHIHLVLSESKNFEARERERTDRRLGPLPRSAFNRSQRIVFQDPPDLVIPTDDLALDAIYRLVIDYATHRFPNDVG